MEFTSADGERRYAALVRAAPECVVGLDFDGTLVADRRRPDAGAHPPRRRRRAGRPGPPGARGRGRSPAGRPGRCWRSAGSTRSATRSARRARSCYVFGQYGNERWSSTEPAGDLAAAAARAGRPSSASCRGCCAQADAADAWVEEKGLAVAVHTRRLRRPARGVRAAAAAGPGARRAARPRRRAGPQRRGGALAGHGQGRRACDTLVERARRRRRSSSPATTSATSRPSRRCAALREQGMPTLLVCSGSEEESALADLADVVVKGPDGVLALLRRARWPPRRGGARLSAPGAAAAIPSRHRGTRCAHPETHAVQLVGQLIERD